MGMKRWRGSSIMLYAYCMLLLYGSLYPFVGWRFPEGYSATILGLTWPRHISKSDLVTNLLVYIPLGFLGVRALRGRPGVASVAAITAFGFAFSLGVELLQMFIPSRESSASDFVFNGISTLVGACVGAWGHEESPLGERLLIIRRSWFTPGRTADLCLAAIGLWALSQLAPFVPSIDIGMLKHGLKPLWLTLQGRQPFQPWVMAVYAFNIAGLAGATVAAAAHRGKVLMVFAGFAATVLLMKGMMVGRQLSLEAAAGYALAMLVVPVFLFLPRQALASASFVAISTGFVIDELRLAPEAAQILHPFNWVPFRDHMAKLMGFAGILEGVWPFVTLAVLCQMAKPRRRQMVFLAGGLIAAGAVFALEWHQQFLPGRYPDITSVVVVLVGWAMPWIVEKHEPQGAPGHGESRSPGRVSLR